jgi:DNA-binding transcriptional regulator YiaG
VQKARWAPVDDGKKQAGPGLYRIRTARGISVTELARSLGCSTSLVFAWESGRSRPSSLELAALSRILDVEAEEICS